MSNEKLRELFIQNFSQLNDKLSADEILKNLLDFFEGEVERLLADDAHLSVFMSKKFWSLYHSLEPLIYYYDERKRVQFETVKNRITNDLFLVSTLNHLETQGVSRDAVSIH